MSALRELADEVGTPVSRRKTDLSGPDFDALHAQVLAACSTDDQRRRAEDARSKYRSDPLPPVVGAQGAGGPAPPAGAQPAADGAENHSPDTVLGRSSCMPAARSRRP